MTPIWPVASASARTRRWSSRTSSSVETGSGVRTGGSSPTFRPSATPESARTSTTRATHAKSGGRALDERVAEALPFARRNMLVRATKAPARMERPQFSERAVFEAPVNAVAHRDYSMAGAGIRLHLFGDRLELHVPGALASTRALDRLHLRQSSRNELVMSLLARCPGPTGLDRSHMIRTNFCLERVSCGYLRACGSGSVQPLPGSSGEMWEREFRSRQG